MRTTKLMQTARRREGAALIEGVIAISTIAVLFAGVHFFHVLQAQKSETLRTARYQAWQATKPGCGRSLHGEFERTVDVPLEIRSAGIAPTITVQSALDMACNEKPLPHDDAFAVLQWITNTGQDALFEPAIDFVKGFIRW